MTLRSLVLALTLLAVSAPVSLAGDPSANRTLGPITQAACWQAPAGSTCQTDVLAAINAARAAEGIQPMVLPTNFASLSAPDQLLVISDLERTARGLEPITGLSSALDADAATGAADDADPTPSDFTGTAWTSNWEGGYGSTLESDFAWMYDDGLGSSNLDCTPLNQSGCWGHRHDILYPFQPPVVMGAAATTARYGPSMTELFVGGDRAQSADTGAASVAGSDASSSSGVNGQAIGSAHGGTGGTSRRGVRHRAHHAARRRHRRSR